MDPDKALWTYRGRPVRPGPLALSVVTGSLGVNAVLHASVLKKAVGYHCGHTITRVMQKLRLIGKNGNLLKRGRMLLRTDADFCTYLLREHHVAVVPGGVLGLAPYFRISYAASTADLQEACARIQRACQAIRPMVNNATVSFSSTTARPENITNADNVVSTTILSHFNPCRHPIEVNLITEN